jgi:putative spermidine/putrescine transport system substrate-binding protein
MDKKAPRISRRSFLIGAGTATALATLSGCGPSQAGAPNQPAAGASAQAGGGAATGGSGPLTITVIDVAGNLQLTKGMIDDYAAANASKIAKVEYTKATAPELASKIKAQQGANQVDIALVLTGTDGLSAGIEQNLWVKIIPDHADKFPGLKENYIQPGAQELSQGFGINLVFGNYGPTFTYNPQKIQTPPKNPQELLDWAKANNGQLLYARPANSGPGRTLLMGLPYLLGDSNPKDPEKGWDKTWSYLQELGQYVEYYPSGTSPTMKELGEGSRAVVASTMGWDLNPRILGTVPKEFKAFALDTKHLVADAQFAAIPKGLDDARQQAVLDLIAWMLKPDQQAKAYDQGYFYPGPAVKNVSLDMAPADSQQAIKSVLRPEFDELIKNASLELPLDAPSLVKAFDIWDKRIGGDKVKKS